MIKSFQAKIQTVHILVGLMLLTTFLTAGMFTFHLGVWDLQSQQVQKIEQQAQDLQNILNAIDRNTKQSALDSKMRSQAATDERQLQINLTQDVKHILEQQGNLSQQNREGLITAINQTYYETIPQINKALQEIRDAQPQSNFTAQKEGVANIEKILENQEEILSKLNQTTR